ncbi:unnamed protein product [Eruca vesicaria subsp. sativa]|uniref:Protein kinase domain-containing protein n=1 Tax=Eruca vesicaria subsp. sativa TaxID=29727 RepID=A0ABC8L2Q8_ERUVS|nr:unnamed protein product [Eruca vesicaria subsp. sativa]
MGCICSKGAEEKEDNVAFHRQKGNWNKSSSRRQLVDRSNKDDFSHKAVDGSSGGGRRASGLIVPLDDSHDGKTVIVDRPSRSHRGRKVSDNGKGEGLIISNVPRSAEAELIAAGWPYWLTSVAGEAIKGWVPRRADSFQKLDKIGQGTYSVVYKARDLETGQIVAMKKVRFANMDPESVRFMAREINILRKLDHPNVMKLQCIVTSKLSGSLHLVFEYMEHDLSGLSLRPDVKFTEPQIKCFMKQLLCGLEHCHSRGILHRDIKGSNLLVNNDGVLKIGDFGLASFYNPDHDQPLTSRVVTLWYRAPELLLGSTEYGPAIDLWSVEQMHKIFKLCGSASKDFWETTKFPQATSYRPQHPYKRVLQETFKNFPSSSLALLDKLLSVEPETRCSASSTLLSEFFTTEPLPCHISSLPKYPPSKELDAKKRNEEVRRKKAEAVKWRGHESVVRRGLRDSKITPEFLASGYSNVSLNTPLGFKKESGKRFANTNSMVHTSSTWNKNGSSRSNVGEVRASRSNNVLVAMGDYLSSSSQKENVPSRVPTTAYSRKTNRMHCSGPLIPPGGNIEDMMKDHERGIQEAVRKSRLDKSAAKKNKGISVRACAL